MLEGIILPAVCYCCFINHFICVMLVLTGSSSFIKLIAIQAPFVCNVLNIQFYPLAIYQTENPNNRSLYCFMTSRIIVTLLMHYVLKNTPYRLIG